MFVDSAQGIDATNVSPAVRRCLGPLETGACQRDLPVIFG